jgi:hypothetical protein
MIRYTIKLSKVEVEELQEIISRGKHSAQTIRAAYILLNCDEGKFSEKSTNEQISQVLKIGMRTIDRVKKKFVDEGMEKALERRATSRIYDRKIDGDVEAKLVALCCSEPPAGHAKWSLRLLADKLVELKYVDKISHVAVGNILKKTNLNRGEPKAG